MGDLAAAATDKATVEIRPSNGCCHAVVLSCFLSYLFVGLVKTWVVTFVCFKSSIIAK